MILEIKLDLLWSASGDRKLGVIGREQKETTRCKDEKKKSNPIALFSFYLLFTN